MNSNFENLNGGKKNLLLHLKIQHLRLKFLCLFFSEPPGPSEDSPQRAADDIVLCGLHLLV